MDYLAGFANKNTRALNVLIEAKDNIKQCKALVKANQKKLREAWKMLNATALDSDLSGGYISDESVREPLIKKYHKKWANWVIVMII